MKKVLLGLVGFTAINGWADNFIVNQDTEFGGQPYFYTLQQELCEQKKCSDDFREQLSEYINFSIIYLESNNEKINQIINKEINRSLTGLYQFAELNPPKDLEQTTAALTTEQLEDYLAPVAHYIYQEIIDVSEGVSRSGIEFNITPKYLGHFQDIEMLMLDQNEYMGGAHGMGTEIFYNFYHDKQLTLDDILLPNQKETFTKLAKEAFMNSEYKEGLLDDFALTENFTFTEKGIKLLWQPYEITSYATGMPIVTLSYSSLKDVVKPEFLGK